MTYHKSRAKIAILYGLAKGFNLFYLIYSSFSSSYFLKLSKFRKCALKGQKHFVHVILLPLQGVISIIFHTQGAALGYKLLAFLAPKLYASVP